MEELQAIRRCRGGDRAAFRFLVDRYGDLVYRTAYLILRDRGLAEDLTQEAFIAAWRGLGRFDPGRPFKPWLLRIVVNRCLSEGRKRAAVVAEPERSGFGPGSDDGLLPERVALLHDKQRLVRAAIGALDEEMRLAVLLRYFGDLSVPEIADVLSCPQGTVKSRLHRAMERLRQSLAGQSAASCAADLLAE